MKVHRSLIALAATGLLASAFVAGVAGPAAAAPTRPVSGGGSASASVVNLGAAAKLPDIRPQSAPDQPDRKPTLPIKPSVGARPSAPARSPAAAGPNSAAQPGAPITPLAAPAVVTNFDGVNESVGCGGCSPPDPSAATSGTEIVELVNTFIQVTDTTGTIQCGGGVTLNRLLRSTDSLTDPRVQFDNVNRRFSLAVTINPASASATPAMWVAASDSADACGTWRVYRLTFNGSPFPAGTFLDFPMLGQDARALLISTRNFTHPGINFTVFGLPKSTIYSGATVSFSTFNVASLTAPVTNAGQPMISSPFSYFLAAVPGTGYRLYRLSNSGGSGATLTLQATISSPFKAPTRRVNQPGTTSTIDPSDGNILASPYYDGTSIWFTHDFDFVGFPTVRYGAVNVSANTVTTAMAYHSGTSDDFLPSLGVGINPGGNFVYLNWSYTDTPAGVATSDTVDMVAPGGGVPNLIATGVVLVNGSITAQDRFGDFSSVAIDPAIPGGSCAVTAQQYFAPGGSWRTRIARLGNCQTPVVVPDVRGDDPSQAADVLAAAGLAVGQVIGVTDNTCNNLGTVASQNPGPGAQVAPGTAVTLFIGQPPPPPFVCP